MYYFRKPPKHVPTNINDFTVNAVPIFTKVTFFVYGSVLFHSLSPTFDPNNHAIHFELNRNNDTLKKLSLEIYIIMLSFQKPIPLKVLRDDKEMKLSLIPTRWKPDKGLLG